jgi:hypothetical protein
VAAEQVVDRTDPAVGDKAHVVRSGALADAPPDPAPARKRPGSRDHLRPVDLTDP